MNFSLLFPLLITSAVTIFGFYLVHFFSKKRDLESKRKEIRLNYLIDAWRALEQAAERKLVDGGFDKKNNIERPIADIQLFGTSKQIELAQKIADDLVYTQKASVTDLLDELRNDLRKELELEPAEHKMRYLRIN